jgi:hypothetical protein
MMPVMPVITQAAGLRLALALAVPLPVDSDSRHWHWQSLQVEPTTVVLLRRYLVVGR